jgi:hypothetical protein
MLAYGTQQQRPPRRKTYAAQARISDTLALRAAMGSTAAPRTGLEGGTSDRFYRSRRVFV